MENVTIISHLTLQEWKRSWEDKVVEDTKENMRTYQATTCYWGHFTSDNDFVICHHKEYEVKGTSLGLYFNGHIEKDAQGCKITGKFGKKKTANLFLAMGAVLCLVAMFGSMARNDFEVLIVSAVLFTILMICYLAKPKKGQEQILSILKKISFDDAYHNTKLGKKKKGKRSIKEIATSTLVSVDEE